MRVVVLASFAESLINFRGHFIQAMVSEGHEVVAIAPDLSEKTTSLLGGWGVKTYSIVLNRTGMNPLQDWQSYRSLVVLLGKLQPHCLFSYTVKPVIYGSLAAHQAGVPRIYSMITGLGYAFMGRNWKDRIVGSGIRWLYHRALRVNQKLFFQNPDDRDLFIRLRLLQSADQTVIINGSGVDLDHFKPVSLPEAPVFLLVARLLRDKGIVEYVTAAGRLKKKYPNARFLLVGWYDQHPTAIQPQEVAAWERLLGVEYLGVKKDVREVMAMASIYVLPSYREGTPRTVLEAMAMGRPVITTDTPGCRETVSEGGNGLLVTVKDDVSLATAMETMILDRALRGRMGERGREIAEQKYDVHKVNEVLMKTMGLLR